MLSKQTNKLTSGKIIHKCNRTHTESTEVLDASNRCTASPKNAGILTELHNPGTDCFIRRCGVKHVFVRIEPQDRCLMAIHSSQSLACDGAERHYQTICSSRENRLFGFVDGDRVNRHCVTRQNVA